MLPAASHTAPSVPQAPEGRPLSLRKLWQLPEPRDLGVSWAAGLSEDASLGPATLTHFCTMLKFDLCLNVSIGNSRYFVACNIELFPVLERSP